VLSLVLVSYDCIDERVGLSVVATFKVVIKVIFVVILSLIVTVVVYSSLVTISGSTGRTLSLALRVFPPATVCVRLQRVQRTEVIEHAESGFVGLSNVKDIDIRFCDSVDSVHHDSCILC